MIKLFVPLVMIFVLGLAMPVMAAETGSGKIEGRIVNGTSGSSNVVDQTITLKVSRDGSEVDSIDAVTDAEGYFTFNGLSTEPQYSYQAQTDFQLGEYYSEQLSFAEGEDTKSIELMVYDSTTSDEAIRVVMAHTIVYPEEGSLWVENYLVFVNNSDLTYVGSGEVTATGRMATLRFTLPEEAVDVQYARGLMDCCVVGGADGISDTMSVLPGMREMVYYYRVAPRSGSYELAQKMNYPTDEFSLLVYGEGIEIATDQLVAQGPVDINGVQFNHYAGANFAAGAVLEAKLSGITGTGNTGTIIWVVVALVVLAAGAALIYMARKRSLHPAGAEVKTGQDGLGLMAELARLDDDFESGKISEENYRRLRAERKAQLVELIKGSREGSDRKQ